jgi:hypothetical protein
MLALILNGRPGSSQFRAKNKKATANNTPKVAKKFTGT